MNYILELENLTKHYFVKAGIFKKTVGTVKAVNNISLKIQKGEVFGLVGESGSGKTTVGKLILGLTSIMFPARRSFRILIRLADT